MTARTRVVAITGAGGALGAAVSKQLAGEPATDLVLSDVSAASLEATVTGLGPAGRVGGDDAGRRERLRPGRVGGRPGGRALRPARRAHQQRRRALPNGRIHNLATEDWERAFRVNVLGAVNGIRAAVAVMRPQRSGSIVLTASVAGLTAWSHAAPYCATKAAVIQLAKVAAVEYARDGIRVNCVCPGTFLLGHPRRPPAGGPRRHGGAPSPRARHGRRPGRCLLLPGR